MSEEVIIIRGDTENSGLVCITDDSRPDPSHCWMRASSHIFRMKSLSFFVQLEAVTTCRHMAEAILKQPRPPQRAIPIKWGWGKPLPGVR